VVTGSASANIAELVVWHSGDEGDRRRTVSLYTNADPPRCGLCECEGRLSSMGALGIGRVQVTGPYPVLK
jgi:hypothetical protein